VITILTPIYTEYILSRKDISYITIDIHKIFLLFSLNISQFSVNSNQILKIFQIGKMISEMLTQTLLFTKVMDNIIIVS